MPQGAGRAGVEDALLRLREGLQGEYARLEMERGNLAQRMERAGGAEKEALEEALTTNGIRMQRVELQINALETQLSSLRGVGVGETRFATVPPPRQTPSFPEELIAIPVMFILCVGLPLSIAYARRIWRRAGEIGAGVPREVMDRLQRIDQNIDAIALEVERIGESQRYMARHQVDQLGSGAGARDGLRQAERGSERVER